MSQKCIRLGRAVPVAAAAARRRCFIVRAVAAESAADAFKAKVSFTLPHHVEFGQEICVVGEAETLGKWDATAAVPLNWTDGDVWIAEAEVPVGAAVEYKYIVRSPDNGEVLEWQPCNNLVLELPPAASAEGPIIIKDHWEGEDHQLLIGEAAAAAAPVAAKAAAAEAIGEAVAATIHAVEQVTAVAATPLIDAQVPAIEANVAAVEAASKVAAAAQEVEALAAAAAEAAAVESAPVVTQQEPAKGAAARQAAAPAAPVEAAPAAAVETPTAPVAAAAAAAVPVAIEAPAAPVAAVPVAPTAPLEEGSAASEKPREAHSGKERAKPSSPRPTSSNLPSRRNSSRGAKGSRPN